MESEKLISYFHIKKLDLKPFIKKCFFKITHFSLILLKQLFIQNN